MKETFLATPTVRILRRFNGPTTSANGGYAAGLLAQVIAGPARVTLHRPPPLETDLVLEASEGGATLRDGDQTIATAVPAEVSLEVPPAPSVGSAVQDSTGFRGFKEHPFPACFVCGPRRAGGDGLRIFPGQVSGEERLVAPWIPAPDLAGSDGTVRPEYVWAALDCPSGWAALALMSTGHEVAVLGTLEVALRRPVAAGGQYALGAWPVRSDGRKLVAGAALWSESGRVHAVASATWVRVPRERWL